MDGSRVHSVRLPGYTIGLEVRFGQAEERLTLAYDGGTSPAPYIAGTLLAIRRVASVTGLVRGLVPCAPWVVRVPRASCLVRRSRARYTASVAPISRENLQLIGQLSTIGLSFVFAIVLVMPFSFTANKLWSFRR